ncbi:hypothetical protein FACS189431_4370 [Alphaproteobacteria bacterium]|nr:hypothetical protein FACS189431_4370 [Alphaproteobacteria bacterium]
MKYDEIIKKLHELAEGNDEYRRFNARIVNDPSVEFIGVRMPALRVVAKEISRGDWREFLDKNTWKTQEEKLLACMLPKYIKPILGFEQFFDYFEIVIPHLSSWALTDCLGTKYPQIQEDQVKSWRRIVRYLHSKNQWEVRFGVILLMANFSNDEYIDRVMMEIRKIKSDEYYVRMAIAWLLATAAINYRDKVERILSEIDSQTAKFTRQKMRDSYQIR